MMTILTLVNTGGCILTQPLLEDGGTVGPLWVDKFLPAPR